VVQTQQEYGLALPDNRHYRGLVSRLRRSLGGRFCLVVLWVRRAARGYEVREER